MKDKALFEGKEFWSGCVSLLDGMIEEVHTYDEAEYADFHHSMYFSSSAISRMDNEESAFFFIDDNGRVQGTWRDDIDDNIIHKIEQQIVIEQDVNRKLEDDYER